jgi:hypothetical protein
MVSIILIAVFFGTLLNFPKTFGIFFVAPILGFTLGGCVWLLASIAMEVPLSFDVFLYSSCGLTGAIGLAVGLS